MTRSMSCLFMFALILLATSHQACGFGKMGRSFRARSGSMASHMHSSIFCNVELNAQNLEAIGFDMDFTLAQYNREFDLLAFEGAKKHLHQQFNYPAAVLDIEYSPDAFCRGLVIDKKRGNILKIDRHKYVRQAFHGLQELDRPTRKALYMKQVETFTGSDYVNIDTLFLLIDAMLFANLVELKSRFPEIGRSYEQIFRDVRASVDLCHRDGNIKNAVMQNPGKYIQEDADLVPMLEQLRDSGKKVFLLTNSLWEYTEVVMAHLCGVRWQGFFDVIIVGARKPAFLTDDYISLYKVERDGSLYNIEDKDSLSKIAARSHSPALSAAAGSSRSTAEHSKPEAAEIEERVFQGGHWLDLHKMLDISFGDRILYVGDHMYSDILRSKRTLGWRTCLIIPELDAELETARRETRLREKVLRMRQLQYDLDEFVDLLRKRQSMGEDVSAPLAEAERKAVELKQTVMTVANSYNAKFNGNWGQLFKAGWQDSRFAKQVTDYACLYTSRASNLVNVSPNRPFRPVQDFMPHDQVMFDSEHLYSLAAETN